MVQMATTTTITTIVVILIAMSNVDSFAVGVDGVEAVPEDSVFPITSVHARFFGSELMFYINFNPEL